jgi:hypothetical protein
MLPETVKVEYLIISPKVGATCPNVIPLTYSIRKNKKVYFVRFFMMYSLKLD